MLKTLTALTLSLCLPCLAMAQTPQVLPASVEKILKDSKLSSQDLALAIIPLDGPGSPRYLNAERELNPASTMKLVTTYAALELLGPAYRWQTRLYADGTISNGVLDGNLYLKGGGDPKLTLERLWLLLRDLRIAGVQTVKGDLVLERSHFRLPPATPFDDDGNDPSRPFLVEPDAALINLKTLRFVTRAERGQASIHVEPPIASVEVINQIEVQPANKNCAAWPDIRYLSQQNPSGALQVTVSGKLPEGCSTQRYLALLDHPGYTAGAIRALWQELGGRIEGQDREGELPKNAVLLASAESPDLVDVIRDINKYSNNTMARQLFLSLGAAKRLPEDLDDAQAAKRIIRDWMASKGINPQGLVMENGSGLSRNERITAYEMGNLLLAAWRSPYAAEFIASLPLAATDGTMRRRLRGTSLAGAAHVKTGSLKDVRALAGYTRDASGHTWAVVAMLNHPQPWGGTAAIDQLLQEIYRQPTSQTAGN